jgi:hypothetical protein
MFNGAAQSRTLDFPAVTNESPVPPQALFTSTPASPRTNIRDTAFALPKGSIHCDALWAAPNYRALPACLQNGRRRFIDLHSTRD